jgi:hypothetical protein
MAKLAVRRSEFIGNHSAAKKFTSIGADVSACNSAGTANWASPEDMMHKAWTVAALALVLSLAGAAAPAPAQNAPQQPGDVLAPAPKLNLTLEQRHTIRELVKDMKADAAEVKAEVGDQVPQGITPHPMPSEVAQKVPQVKSHRFILTAEQIVIVDPKDNKVADVIKLAAE